MNSYESLKARIELYYEPIYNKFSKLYNDATESERRTYESNIRRYLEMLEEIRKASEALRYFKDDVKNNTRQQALFSAILLVLIFLILWLEGHYLLLALGLVVVYITYEIKNVKSELLITRKEEQLQKSKKRLAVIGPNAEYVAVMDWQNSFDIKSDFYREHDFESLGSNLNKEIALINIKGAILRKALNKNLVVTETLREQQNYDDWTSIVPPRLMYESLEAEMNDNA